jgi:hypothetical protein
MLFYVALTRAEDFLVVTDSRPSAFLDLLRSNRRICQDLLADPFLTSLTIAWLFNEFSPRSGAGGACPGGQRLSD